MDDDKEVQRERVGSEGGINTGKSVNTHTKWGYLYIVTIRNSSAVWVSCSIMINSELSVH
jgi:hypothetical protein